MTGTGGSRGRIHRVQSLGNARPTNLRFDMPPTASPRDKRTNTNGRARQGCTVCPSCSATVQCKLATDAEVTPEAGIRKGAVIIGQHRPGGGVYSARRGDLRCPGSYTLPVNPVDTPTPPTTPEDPS